MQRRAIKRGTGVGSSVGTSILYRGARGNISDSGISGQDLKKVMTPKLPVWEVM